MNSVKRLYNLIFKEYRCFVTAILVLLNVLVFGWMFIQTGLMEFDGNIMYDYGAMVQEYSKTGEWYRLVTSMFLHFDLKHLGNNMLMLIVMGSLIERYMGSVPFGIMYLVSGCMANVFSAWSYTRLGENVISAGASGGVFAVAGALVLILLINRRVLGNGMSIQRLLAFVVLLVIQCFSQEGVDNYAHLGGLVMGFVLTAVWICLKKLFGKETIYED